MLRMQSFPWGGTRMSGCFFPEELCNQSPGFCCIVQPGGEHLHPPCCLLDGRPAKTYMKTQCYVRSELLPPPYPGGSSLPGSPFRIGIPYKTSIETPLPEVHLPGDSRPDLPGPAYARHLCEDGVGKDKGSLGVSTLVDHPLPFHSQDDREAAL